MVKFHVISTGWRIEDRLIDRCISSVENQSYRSFTHDCCVDEEGNARFGKMRNFYYMAQDDHGDVIVDLDLDDYLEPNALEIVAKEYESNQNLLMTYGSYKNESGKPARFNGLYRSNNFRGTKWRGAHLRTFKASLFKRIKPRDLKDRSGRWVMVCADMAMFYPMAEMSGLDRIKFIDKPIHVYNDLNPLNDHKTQGAEQKRIEKLLRKRPRYKCL